MANELILVVEDNDKNRKLVRDVLTFKGYEIIEDAVPSFASTSFVQGLGEFGYVEGATSSSNTAQPEGIPTDCPRWPTIWSDPASTSS